jgi:hypothetical protein
MLRRVALVRTDVLEELGSFIIRVTSFGELGTTLAVTTSPILVKLMKEALNSSETSVLTRATRRNIPDDTILQFDNSSILATKTRYMGRNVVEAIEFEVHPYNIKGESGFCLGKLWKPLAGFLNFRDMNQVHLAWQSPHYL